MNGNEAVHVDKSVCSRPECFARQYTVDDLPKKVKRFLELFNNNNTDFFQDVGPWTVWMRVDASGTRDGWTKLHGERLVVSSPRIDSIAGE